MTVLPFVLIRVAKFTHHWLREIAYEDMARQASGWIPDELRIERKSSCRTPIKLDFAIPRKHRLSWIRRTLQHLPH